MILDPTTDHRILFIEVPEDKAAKNRVHLDLVPRSRHPRRGDRAGAGAGATSVNDLRGQWGPGTGWAVMADPEGNEFCILRTEAERG